MNQNQPQSGKPLIGFFPAFGSMGEVIPLIKIAEHYMDRDGEAIFFSHTRRFEYMVKNLGCPLISMDHPLAKRQEKLLPRFNKGVPWETILFRQFDEKTIAESVKVEIKVFTEARVQMIVSAFTPTCSISARACHIPLVVVASGATFPPSVEAGHTPFPEDRENIFTRILPESWKNALMTWWLLNNKKLARPFNKVAARYHLPPFKNTNEVLMGDQTLFCDDIHFLGVEPSEMFPRENFIGPIIDRTPKESKMLDKDLENFIARPGKTIVLVFGSTNELKIFIEIFETLRKTDFKVIAVSKDLLASDFGPNILIREFIPLEEVIKKADLVISHGGRGTIYTIAYAGKPAICIPLSYEHQINIDNLVRVGAAIRIPKKNFKAQQLVSALRTIFNNYEMYLKHAQALSISLPKESGETRAVQRLVDILQSCQETTTYS